MRIARKIALLAAMALAAMALTATTAFAENEEIDVVGEPTGTCTTVSVANHVVSGGCAVTVTGEIDLVGYPFGHCCPIQASTCNAVFTGRIGGDGAGFATSATLSDHAPSNDCVRRPCTEENEGSNAFKPWPVSLHEEAGIAYLQAEFCVWNDNDMTDQRCGVEIPLAESPTHVYSSNLPSPSLEGEAHTPSLPFGCGIRGQATVSGTGIELVH